MDTRGYSMPFTADRRKSFLLLAMLTILLPALIILYNLRATEDGFSPVARQKLTLLCIVVFIPCFAVYFVRCFAKLHFVSEGIAVTLWGLTIRRFPAEQIRFLSAVHDTSTKADAIDLIAVCDYSLEELTELSRKRTPKMFQNSLELWPGEWAGKYLFVRSQSLAGNHNLHRRILWLEWDCERLEILLKLYPNAQWLDCTQKKIFDDQLRQR